VGTAKPLDGEAFMSSGEKVNGSWWPHWRDWLFERSGAEIPAPASLGSNRHPPGAAAPGTYVFD
jgi:polyhydroxyalkanoate synthase